jgi:uncharacterized protein YggE
MTRMRPKNSLRAIALASAALGLAAAAPAQAQLAGGPPPAPMMRMEGALLHVAAESQVRAAPDLATITLGVQTDAATAQAALAENAKRMQAVFAALKKAGVADKDVQTSNLSIAPQYAYAEREPPKLTGYQASNQVSVIVRDLKRLGATVDAVVGSGSNQVNGVTFGLADPDRALDQARKDAVAKARARAELYAQAAGLKVARIVAISEGGDAAIPPMPMPMAKMAMAEATPTAPGELALSVTVNVAFELR